jgi:formamidopyrimidine-DNA glycosylase
MPELPEVETVVRGLRQALTDRIIRDIIHCSPHLKKKNIRGFPKTLIGRKVASIDRVGKNIFINFDDDSMLWVHLRMTGQFLLAKKPMPDDNHNHLIIILKGSPQIVVYRDVRKFGQLVYINSRRKSRFFEEMKLGTDAMLISGKKFAGIIKSKNRMIKPLLLDQNLIAGLGNIYVDEILFKSRIHPCKTSSSLSDSKINELFAHMRETLSFAIDNMGTTVDSFAGVDSEPGNFQTYLQVYDQEGSLCPRCGKTRIKRIVVAQRGTHICRVCQRI